MCSVPYGTYRSLQLSPAHRTPLVSTFRPDAPTGARRRPGAIRDERVKHHPPDPEIAKGVVHAKVGQIVTFFAYRPPSRPLGSLTLTQPGRFTNPTQGHPGPPWEAPQAECWSLRREPKPPA